MSSGDHGQNATLGYDTYLRQTSVAIWGVTYCPLKNEVREQYDDRNALLVDDLDNTEGEPKQSCKKQQPTTIYNNVNTEAGISHAHDKTNSSMAVDLYNADPW